MKKIGIHTIKKYPNKSFLKSNGWDYFEKTVPNTAEEEHWMVENTIRKKFLITTYGYKIELHKYGFKWVIFAKQVNTDKMLEYSKRIIELIEQDLKKFEVKYYQKMRVQHVWQMNYGKWYEPSKEFSNVKNFIRLQYKDLVNHGTYYFDFPEEMLPDAAKSIQHLQRCLVDLSTACLLSNDTRESQRMSQNNG